jgi:predicted SAM-dependent methyltransferase
MANLNIDLGGQKHRRDMGGTWKIMDVQKNSDIIYDLNSNKPFPFENNTIDNYYCSMCVEHIPISIVPFILTEIYRTLKTNGILRIVVPDIEIAIKWYLENPKLLLSKDAPTKPNEYPNTKLGYFLGWIITPNRINKSGDLVNGHHFAYDFETLSLLLREAGFKNKQIKQTEYAKYSSNVFLGKDYERYANLSLYVDSIK